ncbi:hypothetical protein [Exiguobacterium sp. SH3S1]|uniref:hypothetical protein n=1 Tax=Exiguobacterium sp. SH3S1 TaxID=2510955 RepID=UPI00103CC3E0|nr:hypothetical protein [Exiguobacterium sp. SH3S1]TCI60348.1 hypothetical protein EVJ26_11275 [Exiguobacterium sp. SH3S1]
MDKIKLTQWERKKYGAYLEHLRKYPDSYEYCVLPHYEDYMETAKTECVQMGDCYAVLMKQGDHYVLVAILFDIESEVTEILEWLDHTEVRCLTPTTETVIVRDASEILDEVKFKGQPLLLIEQGTQTFLIDPEDLNEVTEAYDQYNKINNTGLAEDVTLQTD